MKPPSAVSIAIGCLCFALILTLACSGGDDDPTADILHLPDQDVSEEALQGYYRGLISANLVVGLLVCGQVADLAPSGADAFLRTIGQLAKGTMTPIPGATPRPGQLGDNDDMLRAATIFQAECQRILDA